MTKWIARALPMVASLALLAGVAGCQENNDEAAKITSTPPAAGSAGPAKTQQEYMKNNMQGATDYKGQGYPGAK